MPRKIAGIVWFYPTAMANQKVLIVDDSKTVRMQVREMLPKGNFEVLEAEDGLESLAIINRESPSLILIDFFMPQMNGWEVVQKLKDHPRLKTIPVVLISGRREDVEQTVPDLFSYFEFVSKPFDQPMLMQAIKGAMAKARVRQQAAPKAVQPSPSESSERPSERPTDLQTLQAEVRSLRQDNLRLQNELDSLKKQVAQITAFIRQRLKSG